MANPFFAADLASLSKATVGSVGSLLVTIIVNTTIMMNAIRYKTAMIDKAIPYPVLPDSSILFEIAKVERKALTKMNTATTHEAI